MFRVRFLGAKKYFTNDIPCRYKYLNNFSINVCTIHITRTYCKYCDGQTKMSCFRL